MTSYQRRFQCSAFLFKPSSSFSRDPLPHFVAAAPHRGQWHHHSGHGRYNRRSQRRGPVHRAAQLGTVLSSVRIQASHVAYPELILIHVKMTAFIGSLSSQPKTMMLTYYRIFTPLLVA